ncbi:DUF3783 domain-containing protein [Clostridium sp. AL.422]|uniref:DUF3783 domain-containing protein n=1 Tax=Clostridium TaxID=1485 RepID=UPI00293DA50E|nr:MULTISPECIES: DUF3783 domain-containing protein [unclassified Clostridium]MDV4150150.1 DUF3783 domain-containing protein [Clostridium sp. AL.422]
MLSNDKCILIYNAPESELKELRNEGYKLIEVSKEMTEMTVSDILHGLRFETVNVELPNETVILFNCFSDEEIKLAITGIRQRFKGGIFAAVTPTSIEWKFSYLIEHLIEEREWYLKNQKGRS